MSKRSIPLASQLVRELATDISSGALIDGDGRLPSEPELGRRYNVGRSTVREALAQLERLGVIVRRHGVGTFVSHSIRHNPGTIWGWLDEAPAFVDLIERSGFEGECRLLKVSLRKAGAAPTLLNVLPDTPIVFVEKVFSADGAPVIYSATMIPRQMLYAGAVAEPLQETLFSLSIYDIFQQYSDYSVNYQASELRATSTDAQKASLFACPIGEPLLAVEEIGFSDEQVALFYARHYFRGDRITFRQVRVPTFSVIDEGVVNHRALAMPMD